MNDYLLSFVGVFAQEKTIDQNEFDAACKGSSRWLAGRAFREIQISQSSYKIIPQPDVPTTLTAATLPPRKTLIKSTTEFLPTGGFHSVFEFSAESMNSKKETIRIAGKTYTREGGGQWTEGAPSVKPKSESTTETIDNQIEYKFLVSEQLNNQNANVYAKVQKSKLVSLTGSRESSSTATIKYWFGEDGRLLKTESDREIRNEKSVGNFRSTTIYELDPNIKIETPKLN